MKGFRAGRDPRDPLAAIWRTAREEVRAVAQCKVDKARRGKRGEGKWEGF